MIKVYLADIGTMDGDTRDRLFAVLSTERKERVLRYKREKDRLLGIGAGALVSMALSEELQKDPGGSAATFMRDLRKATDGSAATFKRDSRQETGAEVLLCEVGFASLDTEGFPSPAELETGKGAHGKPYLKKYPAWHFNLSHSGTKVMLACSASELGVDIEKTGPVRERVLGKAFAPAEQRYVNAAEGAERDRRFTEVWARKESFLKACGTGIERELGTLSVIGEDGKPVRSIVTEEGSYDLYCPAEIDGYECFLCVKRG